MNCNVLVTGSSGHLGSRLCDALEQKGFNVHRNGRNVADQKISFDLANDADKLLDCLKHLKPNIIFHTAGVLSNTHSKNLYIDNIKMAEQLVYAISQLSPAQRPLVVNFSSAAELGEVPESIKTVTEEFSCAPITDYGMSKLTQTEIMLSGAKYFDFRCINARIFNCLDLPNSPVQSWVNQIKLIQQKKLQPILHVGNLHITRDFLDAAEIIQIIIELSHVSDAQGTINIASGIGTPLSKIVETLKELSSVKFDTYIDPEYLRSKDIKSVVADTTKLETLLGRSIQCNIPFVLQQMLHK